MAIYAIHHQEPKFIFIINYKVMYSSLYKILPKYFPEVEFYYKSQLTGINNLDYSKFAIVRNPYDRTVSAFYEKCRKSPKISLHEEKAQLQYCQHQLLHTLKVIRKDTFEIVQPAIFYNSSGNPKERLLLNENFKLLTSISFEEYVKSLTLILKENDVDGHFQKQYNAFFIFRQNPFYFLSSAFKNTTIIKLENIDQDWKKTCDSLGKKMTLIKKNKTDNMRPSFEKLYTTETRKLVAKIYGIDFKKFNYSNQL